MGATAHPRSPDTSDATVADAPDPTALAEDVTGCDPAYASDDGSTTCPLFLATWTCPGTARFRAMVATADGGFALAGELAGHAWLVRTDGRGKVLWQMVFAALDEADAITETAGGGLLAVTRHGDSLDDSLNHWSILRADASGAVIWHKSWLPGVAPDWGVPTFILALSDGGVAVAGIRQTATGTTYGGNPEHAPWVARLDGAGNAVWSRDYPQFYGEQGTGAVGFAALPDGGFALGWFGSGHMGTSVQGRARLDAAGTVVWAEPGHGTNIVAVADGGFATTGGYCPSVDRLDAQGVTAWSAVVAPCAYPDWAWQSLAPLPDGDIAVTAPPIPLPSAPSTRSPDSLVRLTASGTVRWARDTPGLSTSAIAGLPDSGVAVAGRHGDGAFLMRTDRSGHASCAASGACAATAPSACDDGNPCTADLCSAKAGCMHAALADRTSCASKPTGSAYGDPWKLCTGGECGDWQ